MASAQLCVLQSPDITEMDRVRQDQINKPVTLRNPEATQNGNRDIVSITEGSTEQAVRSNGNCTSGKERTSGVNEKKSTKDKSKKTPLNPSHESHPGVKKERTRSHRGGKMDQGVTGDRKQTTEGKEQSMDKNTGRGKYRQRTRDERNKTKTDRDRSRRAEGKSPKRTPTQAGGHGRRTADRDNSRDSGATRMAKGSVNTGSGTSTSQDHTAEAKNGADTPLRSDFGSDSRAMFLDVISKLFPLDINAEPSTSSTEPVIEPDIPTTAGEGSPAPSTLDETLVAVEALGNNFQDLAKWFQVFESSKARDVIGFDLAMELCGCYDLIIRRLGNGIRDTFGQTIFIQSAQHVKAADQALEYIATFVKGDGTRELKLVLDELGCQPDNSAGSETKSIQTAVERMSTDTGNISSAPHIVKSLKVQWALVVEIVRALIAMIQTPNNWPLPGTLESSERQKELTFARQENVRLQSECNTARETIAKLQLGLSIAKQRATMADVYSEDIHRTSLESNNRISELKELHGRTQSKAEDLQREMARITRDQETERAAWSVKVEGLLKELDTTESRIETMQRDHLTEQCDRKNEIDNLKRVMETLSRNEAKLKGDIQDTKIRHIQELDKARSETALRDDNIQQQRAHIKQLTDTIAMCKDKERELLQNLETVTMELATTVDQLLMSKMKLCSLDQLFGLGMANGENRTVLDMIQVLKAASVERLRKVLKRTVVQVIKEDDQEDMDTGSDTGQLFRDYEREIHDIIQRLSSEHRPMDVSGSSHTRQRSIKTPVKRRPVPIATLESSAEDHPVRKKQDCTSEVKHEANSEYTVKTERRDDANLRVKMESGWNRNNNMPHCQIITQPNRYHISSHGKVHMLDIELGENDTPGKRPIPDYIARSLVIHNDVKIINLGYEKPIETLLSVLQVSEEIVKDLSDNSQSTCHCSQLTELSQRLDCSLLICWHPGGEHEVYGDEHRDSCLYTLIVYRENRVRSYYLLTVRSEGGSYMYNLARLPSPVKFQLHKQAFVHITQGSCQGPVGSNPTDPIHSVDTIETSHIVLQDHV